MKTHLILLALATTSLTASAATVFSDDFGPGDAKGWFFSSKGALDSVATTGMTLSGGTAVAYFEPFTLATKKGAITLHFTVAFPAIPDDSANVGTGFRFGLFNSHGEHATGTGDTFFLGYEGFVVTTSPTDKATNSKGDVSPTAAVFRHRPAGLDAGDPHSGRLLTTTANYQTVGHKSRPLAKDAPAGKPLDVAFTITRSGGKLELRFALSDGGTVLQSNTTTTGDANFTFDTLAINGNSALGPFIVDDISVETR